MYFIAVKYMVVENGIEEIKFAHTWVKWQWVIALMRYAAKLGMEARIYKVDSKYGYYLDSDGILRKYFHGMPERYDQVDTLIRYGRSFVH